MSSRVKNSKILIQRVRYITLCFHNISTLLTYNIIVSAEEYNNWNNAIIIIEHALKGTIPYLYYISIYVIAHSFCIEKRV